MARWGLRWIFCWLSVLITACGQLASPTPAEKTQNRTPLQGFTPPPMASPTEPFRPAYTMTPLGNPTRVTTTYANLHLEQPTCYETPAQSLVCLGWVQNPGDTSLTDIFIDVHLLSDRDRSFATTSTMPALEMLFPHTGSPYRAIFRQIPTTPWTVYADLKQVREASPVQVSYYAAVDVEDIESYWDTQSYQVSGQIVYDDDIPIEQVWVVVTIWKELNTISGFRMLKLNWQEDISAFEVEVAPLDQVPGERVTVLAQGIN